MFYKKFLQNSIFRKKCFVFYESQEWTNYNKSLINYLFCEWNRKQEREATFWKMEMPGLGEFCYYCFKFHTLKGYSYRMRFRKRLCQGKNPIYDLNNNRLVVKYYHTLLIYTKKEQKINYELFKSFFKISLLLKLSKFWRYHCFWI